MKLVNLSSYTLWDITPRSPTEFNRRVGRTLRVELKAKQEFNMKEAASRLSYIFTNQY
jgi:hypothetical protein